MTTASRGREERVFKTLYTCLSQIRDDMESGRLGPGIPTSGKRGGVEVPGVGIAHIPFSFVALLVCNECGVLDQLLSCLAVATRPSAFGFLVCVTFPWI